MNKFFAIVAVAALMSPAAFADMHKGKKGHKEGTAAGAHGDAHGKDSHGKDGEHADGMHPEGEHADTHAKPAAPAKK